MLKKIADFYNIAANYFVSEENEVKPASRLKDKILLEKFEKIEDFSDEEKKWLLNSSMLSLQNIK